MKEPWTTHRKYQVFDDKYSDIFGRPEVTASRIVLCHILMCEIEDKLDELENRLVAKYTLTKFAILYTLRRIFESDEFGQRILANPKEFVQRSVERAKFLTVVGQLLDALIIDLNLETNDLPNDFDYRGKLRDKNYVTTLTNNLIASYQKDIKRKKAKSMHELWYEV